MWDSFYQSLFWPLSVTQRYALGRESESVALRDREKARTALRKELAYLVEVMFQAVVYENC